MDIWHRYGEFEGVCTMWLYELGTFAMFWGLKNPSITETDILWYDLYEYTCYYFCDLHVSSPLLSSWCLPWIMSYPQCMTHDLAAAHPHDFAWSAQCAKKHLYIGACCCPQEAVLCPLRHGWSDQLYGMEGAWKNSPTCCALLNVGLTAILKRTHIYVLIWACNPASPNSTTVIFQNCSSFKT